jgi:dTDP-4-dehydrorhamnose reductase
MRTLILGAKGQLGRDLALVFQALGEVAGYDLPELDIADTEATCRLLDGPAPDLVINAAAFTDVEGAEDNIEAAFLANATGARNAAELAERWQVPIVYYSTDYVFDGSRSTPYPPEEPLAPLSVYGQSKAAGEAATRQANARHFILRTAWLYGPGGNNFIEKMLRLAAARPALRVVEDEVGSPTHTWDLAEATLALTATKEYGVYHVVNAGACSRYELVREIFLGTGVNTPVTPCAASEFPSKAARPRYSVLDTAKYRAVTGRELRPWQEALHHYLQRREARA